VVAASQPPCPCSLLPAWAPLQPAMARMAAWLLDRAPDRQILRSILVGVPIRLNSHLSSGSPEPLPAAGTWIDESDVQALH
jgi:hypothetical protein